MRKQTTIVVIGALRVKLKLLTSFFSKFIFREIFKIPISHNAKPMHNVCWLVPEYDVLKIKIKVQSQYLVCPPFARVASRILLAMELTRELIFLRGIWFHSCCKAAVSFWTLLERDVVTEPVCQVRQMVFYLGKVRAVRWPIKWNHVFWAKKSRKLESDMRPGIIVLKC